MDCELEMLSLKKTLNQNVFLNQPYVCEKYSFRLKLVTDFNEIRNKSLPQILSANRVSECFMVTLYEYKYTNNKKPKTCIKQFVKLTFKVYY